jgi:RNA polymerase sigma factor (sigma-70 family)
VDAREERFRDMYEGALNRVVAYALRRTVSYEDAADVVAETFAIAWRRLDEIPTGQREVPWLYVVARRVIANRVRGEANRSDVVQRLAHQLTTAAHQHRELDADRLSALDALRHLTDEDREVLMLVAWDGLTSQQLGWALSCSPTAARIRLHRARARLMALLTDDRSTTVEPSPQLQEVPEP